MGLMEFALLADEKIKYDVIHFTHGRHGKWTTIDEYENAYDATIKRLIEICPDSKIIIATPTEYCNAFVEGVPSVNEAATAMLRDRGEVAKRIAAKYNLWLNDMFVVSQQNRALHSSDGVHYTDDGYSMLAKAAK